MRRFVVTMVITLFGCVIAFAQEVTVNAVSLQQVVPPMALSIVANPGRYFSVTVTNTSSQSQNIYLGMDIVRQFPDRSLVLSTPQNRQPSVPISVPANQTVQLSLIEMRRLFNHITSSDLYVSDNIFTGYGKGSYGLLPEGLYVAKFTAYKWSKPQYAHPVVVSGTTNGSASFNVSYKADAPKFLIPSVNESSGVPISEMSQMDVRFVWSESILKNNTNNVRFSYNLRVVEVLKGQAKDYALTFNPVVYQLRNIYSPFCAIPYNYVVNRFEPGKLYAAQVSVRALRTNSSDFVLVDNDGKSDIILFRVVPPKDVTYAFGDTLLDKDILLDKKLLSEELPEETLSKSDYSIMLEDISYGVEESSDKVSMLDSILCVRYSDMCTELSRIKNTSFQDAKKSGSTQRVKDLHGEICEMVTEVDSLTDDVIKGYSLSYHIFTMMSHSKSNEGNGLADNTVVDHEDEGQSDIVPLPGKDECASLVLSSLRHSQACVKVRESVEKLRVIADRKVSYINEVK